MQKNVAGQKIGVQMVNAADGSAFTGSVTVYVTGDAGTQAIGSVSSGACTHEGNGYHTYAPAQAETNYDLIAFTFIGTGAVPVTLQVYTRFDSNLTHSAGTAITSSGGRPEVNTTHAAGTAWNSGAIGASTLASSTITSAKIAAGAITATGIATGAIDADAIAADAVTEIQAGLALAADLATVDTVVDAIKAKTDNLPTDPADQSLVEAAITAAVVSAATIADAVWDEALSGHSTAGTAGLALSTASSGGVDPSVLADAIWDEALSGHATAGTAGAVLSAVNTKTTNLPSDPADQSAVEAAITAATSGLATASALATVDTVVDTILADTNELQTDWANGGRLDLILDVIELWTKRNAVLVTGLLTGSGTNTEVYTISALGITATCTTDSSGNRSAVVWS